MRQVRPLRAGQSRSTHHPGVLSGWRQCKQNEFSKTGNLQILNFSSCGTWRSLQTEKTWQGCAPRFLLLSADWSGASGCASAGLSSLLGTSGIKTPPSDWLLQTACQASRCSWMVRALHTPRVSHVQPKTSYCVCSQALEKN